PDPHRVRRPRRPVVDSDRAELLHVLMLPDLERADRIGEFWGYPKKSRLRGAADRLRGGPNADGGARGDAAGGPELEAHLTGRTVVVGVEAAVRTVSRPADAWPVMAGVDLTPG